MFKNLQKTKLSSRLLMGGALLAAGIGMYSCKDKYDLDSDSKQPSGLTSIYDYLQEQGSYTNYLQLINDLDQAQILKTTGSKTMFVADDEAFKVFFQNNSWGVHSYGELSLAQKKLLLNGSMLDNPYTTNMMSSAESVSATNPAPVRGEVFRRPTSLSLMDSVLVISTKDDIHCPDNAYTARFKQRNETMVVFNDNSTPSPILHFTNAYLTANKLESTDIDFIYNQPNGTRQTEDVYVNDAKIVEPNIYCKNGFVHKVDKVITPLPNMADIIRAEENKDKFSYFNSILERFQSFAVYGSMTEQYNTQYNANVDAAYTLRYFSDRSYGSTAGQSTAFSTDYYGQVSAGKLKYDPSWNGYMPQIANPRVPMMEDMGVMIVPNNDAIKQWWLEGDGKDIKDRYAPNENDVIKGLQMTPITTLQELVNVNMLSSFNASVPSRFASVLNDANEPLGLSPENAREKISNVILGCNGAVYESNEVFAPTSYSSVLFPAVLDTTSFKIIMKAIKTLDYDKYLNSMASRYSFFVPVAKNGTLTYIDPVTYGAATTNLWEFKYDDKNDNIYAEVYEARLEGGTWTKMGSAYKDRVGFKSNKALGAYSGVNNTSGDKMLADRLEDMLDNIIVLGDLESGKEYYRTKGNKYVRVTGFTGSFENEAAPYLKVYGAGQQEWDAPLTVRSIYKKKNGHTYIMEGVIQGGTKTVYGTLSEYSALNGGEFSKFLEILELSGAINRSNTKDNWISGAKEGGLDGNLFSLLQWGDVGAEKKPAGVSGSYKAAYLLNNYHYTIYAPTNAAMDEAYAKGLPTPDYFRQFETEEYMAYEADSLKLEHHRVDSLREVYIDFIKYHIQDNAVFMEPASKGGTYETARTEFIPATAYNEDTQETYETGKYTTGRPYKLNVTVSGSSMSVEDNCKNIANVTIPNLIATEYWFKGGGKTNVGTKPWSTTEIDNSSYAVIHGINHPLLFDEKNQFVYKYKELDSSAVKPRK